MEIPRQLFSCGANLEFVAALCKGAVRFIVVGGLAVQYWVPGREANDLDLLVETTLENCDRLIGVLWSLSLTPQFTAADLKSATPKQIPIKQYYYLDILTPGDQIDFTREWERAPSGLLGRTEVRFAGVQLLLAQKQSSDREKDASDIELLGRIVG